MGAGAAVVTIVAAIIAAAGTGISSASSASASDRQLAEDKERRKEEERLAREEQRRKKFEYGTSFFAKQRQQAGIDARRKTFDTQVMDVLRSPKGFGGVPRGAPSVTTF